MSETLDLFIGDEVAAGGYITVLLPVPIAGAFTYRCTARQMNQLAAGYRILVPFGARKVMTGVVLEVGVAPSTEFKAKEIFEILDDRPLFTSSQLKLLQWTADYYLCFAGDVLNAMLPAGLKLSSESFVQLDPNFERDEAVEFSEQELQLLEVLSQKESLSFKEVQEITDRKHVSPLLYGLYQKEAVLFFENVKDKYVPKREKRIRLEEKFVLSQEELQGVFERTEKRAPKQTEALLKYLSLCNIWKSPEKNEEGVLLSDLSEEGASNAAVNALVKAGVFEKYEQIVSRLKSSTKPKAGPITLTEAQQAAYEQTLKAFEARKPVLLHGVTGSGKTELYIRLIKDCLAQGQQALMILPEIALSTQMVSRLTRHFGSEMGVFHSKYSDNERVEVWKRLVSGECSFIIGVRSACFLPFQDLGLLIIDEEHESAYKQHDPAPRYHGRDLALVLAHLHGARSILGSATPSLESYRHAENGKYQLVELLERFGKVELPEIKLVDLMSDRKKNKLREEFSFDSLKAIEDTVAAGKQAIVFQNRRGYASFLSCNACGHIPQCTQCNVSLTYHRFNHLLRCHYCGMSQQAGNSCFECGSHDLKTNSYGTEKLEESLQLLLPSLKTLRMDFDTTGTRHRIEKLIEEFSSGAYEVLVGTQMVSKGLDFENVQLVVVVNADRLMHFPDFRSREKAFQLLMQLSGRAGRRKERGQMLIQTYQVEDPLYRKLMAQDYYGFYQEELAERKSFGYPPWTRLIKLTIKDKSEKKCAEAAQRLAVALRHAMEQSIVLGPERPSVNKIRNFFIEHIFIKTSNDPKLRQQNKELLHRMILEGQFDGLGSSVRVIIDVDPY
ncbi:MAG: primosomal protein N' [Cyclobacteriaceae bacterium]|nr:primosomal protein N' [Cyclobacteriaceae bacterium]MCH8515458.1 primosomal protein N' [Cyclobacteriaceae bacterium]